MHLLVHLYHHPDDRLQLLAEAGRRSSKNLHLYYIRHPTFHGSLTVYSMDLDGLFVQRIGTLIWEQRALCQGQNHKCPQICSPVFSAPIYKTPTPIASPQTPTIYESFPFHLPSPKTDETSESFSQTPIINNNLIQPIPVTAPIKLVFLPPHLPSNHPPPTTVELKPLYTNKPYVRKKP
jgi:hypothetical protein